jgi:hypothetical protein
LARRLLAAPPHQPELIVNGRELFPEVISQRIDNRSQNGWRLIVTSDRQRNTGATEHSVQTSLHVVAFEE